MANVASTTFDALFPRKSARRIFAGYVRYHPFTCWTAILRSVWFSWRLTGHIFPVVVFVTPLSRIDVKLRPSARTRIHGSITVCTLGADRRPASIAIGHNSLFEVKGNCHIGPNVNICIFDRGELVLGSRIDGDGPNFTSDCRIMVECSTSIGSGCLIAYHTVIIDSDTHSINGQCKRAGTIIGDNVWIAHGVSTLSGSSIPDDSVVGAHTVVRSAFGEPNVLLVGAPARIARRGIRWTP